MFNTLANTLHSIDKEIVAKVLKEVCADLNLVARYKSQFRLMQVYECLNMAKLPAFNVKGGPATQSSRENKTGAGAVFGAGTFGLSSVNSQGKLGPGKSLKIIQQLQIH